MTAPPPQRPDEWDAIDHLTRRVLRWILVGVPSWLILLAVFDERWTGIPLPAGFAMATVVTVVIVAVADIWSGGRRRGRGLSPVGRGLLIWAIAFTVLAVLISVGGRTGVVIVLVPFIGATVVTAFAEFTRRMLVSGRR